MVPFLLARMSDTERTRLETITGDRGAERIASNINGSTLTWAGLDRDGIVVVGGLLPMHDDGAYIWQIATPAIQHNKRGYLTMSRALMPLGLALYGHLFTNVAADYAAALRHMRRCGFVVAAPVEMEGTLVCQCRRTAS